MPRAYRPQNNAKEMHPCRFQYKSKTIWSLVKKQTNSVPKKVKNIELLIDGTKVQNPLQVAEIFNDNLINNLPVTISPSLPQEQDSSSNSLFLYPVDEEEIKSKLLSLNNTSCVGTDGVSISILKKCIDLIKLPLSHCINVSFLTGSYPSALKKSIVKPFFKKGDRSCPDNYRSISVSSNFGKLFEAVLKERLENFVTISENQHGFQKGRSTNTAANYLLNWTFQSLNDGKTAAVILVDLTKAFDLVPHDLLFSKLESLGIRGISLNYCKSYFQGRSQCVEVPFSSNEEFSTHQSSFLPITRGVFAGTILGPSYFTMFLDDVFKLFTHLSDSVRIVAYADDLTLSIVHQDPEQLELLANSVLSTLSKWCNDNGFLINSNKTQLLVLKPSLKVESPQILLNSVILNESPEVDLLGLKIDSRLNWSCHIDHLVPKLRKSIYCFRILRNTMPIESLLVLYHAYFVSRVRYGILFWGSSRMIERILIIQKYCLLTIFNLRRRQSCRNIFPENHLMTIVSIYISEVVNYIHNNLGLFIRNSEIHSHSTRSCHNINLANTHVQIEKKIKLYNKLPIEIRQLPRKKFKGWSREFFSSISFYNIAEYFSYEIPVSTV